MSLQVEAAIREFSWLQNPIIEEGPVSNTSIFDDRVRRIYEFLRSAGRDLSALDPTGNATTEQMEERLKQAVRDARLISARSILNKMETLQVKDVHIADYELFALQQVGNIKAHLKWAKADISELDESGKATKKQVENRLEKAVKHTELVFAKAFLSYMETTNDSVSSNAIAAFSERITTCLAKAGLNASVFDKDNQSGTTRIMHAEKRMHIISAKEEFKVLETGARQDSAELATSIRSHFAKAGENASVLDESGKLTARQMEKRISDAVANARKVCP